MKYFLKNIIGFVGLPLILFIISLWVFARININGLKSENDVTTVFLGDSHMKCGIDPSQFSGAANISENSEHYFFTYYKLKKYIELNPQVKNVFLGFSFHNMSSYYDSHYDGKYAELSSSKSFFFLPREQQIKYALNNKKGVATYYKSIIKRTYSAYKGGLFGFENRFQSTEAHVNTMNNRILGQFYDDEHGLQNLSISNMNFLGKIIGYCKEQDIKLTLVTTPLHSYYKSKVPVEFIESYQNLSDTTSIKIVDFKGLKLDDEDFAPDGDHITLAALHKVSTYLKLEGTHLP